MSSTSVILPFAAVVFFYILCEGEISKRKLHRIDLVKNGTGEMKL